ncbi:MAG TPA: DUF2092 domain-containing protein [Bryobacteraceae bacterium]|nr:DUF2092 domain-containing protein [Bryobacteraceae bacterium]
MRCLANVFLLVLLFAGRLGAQPDVGDILRKVNELYKGATQYEFTVEGGSDRGDAGGSLRTLIAFKAPDRYRMDGVFPGMALDAQESGEGVLFVHDGSTVWLYFRKANEYASIPASALAADSSLGGVAGESRPELFDHRMIGRYRGDWNFPERKFLREETIDYGGGKVDCYVVSVSERKDGFTYTWWVDKKNYRVLRERSPGYSAVFTGIRINEALPDDLFKFVPPPGAKKVELPASN